MEKTIQKMVFDAIKQETGIKYSDIAEKLGVTKGAMTIRMQGSITLDNFFEMLKICGYDIVVAKAPEGREPSISVGKVDCDNCYYKNFYEEHRLLTEKYQRDEENKIIEIK